MGVTVVKHVDLNRGDLNLSQWGLTKHIAVAWSPGLALDSISAVRRMTDPRYDLRLHLMRRWQAQRRRRQSA